VHERRPKKPQNTFVLVADASRARLFRREESGALALLEEHEHPGSRAHNRDLTTDKPGTTFSGGGVSKGRSSMEPRTEPQEVEAEKFARELGDLLARSFDAHAFDELIIAAPPKFLGLLRETLATHKDHVERRVKMWVEKDYTELEPRDLAERLFPNEEAA